MRRHHGPTAFEEPSLVPLADMLSNTVGVMVFIFIFTVITASGVSVPKVFPLERPSDLPFVLLVCRGDRIFALDSDAAIDAFYAPLGKPSFETFETVDAWVDAFNNHKTQTDFFDLAGEGHAEHQGLGVFLDLAVAASPREGQGEMATDLRRQNSRLRVFLDKYPSSKYFIFFIVYPDALKSFQAARSAVLDAGYSTGWDPQPAGEPIRFGNGPGGLTPAPSNG